MFVEKDSRSGHSKVRALDVPLHLGQPSQAPKPKSVEDFHSSENTPKSPLHRYFEQENPGLGRRGKIQCVRIDDSHGISRPEGFSLQLNASLKNKSVNPIFRSLFRVTKIFRFRPCSEVQPGVLVNLDPVVLCPKERQRTSIGSFHLPRRMIAGRNVV